ncbi:IclR family transcriptional regulator [Oceanibacterium hippocampi]|uniref:HTH-type transcriptional regulator KipR n=1 Tax=Oceanibacterium hippocampi TaxID=745714 RepID=A0A1Y5TTL3_9PROT|nr:IclR family transcriptional regulator [Oceanibacterium hippocampi]SLN71942.1 HTH-type transcriptional regulator KipR [Oceanibacterium hippocampi]
MTTEKRDLSRSIKRTLEVLEYFDAEHPSVSVKEISLALGYPQSSTSILLKSLGELGYLHYDKKSRTYRPSPRVALLGRSVAPYLFGEGSVMAAMEDVGQRTGELVNLATPAGIMIQYIHVIPATNPVRLHMHTGAVRPMIGSGMGHLFLAALPNAELDVEIERLMNLLSEPAIGTQELMKEIRKIRRNGYVMATSTGTPGGGLVALRLPGLYGGAPLAIGIGGVANVIASNEERYIRILRDAVKRHIEPLLSRNGKASEPDSATRPALRSVP